MADTMINNKVAIWAKSKIKVLWQMYIDLNKLLVFIYYEFKEHWHKDWKL